MIRTGVKFETPFAVYLNALRLGRLADDERRGGVGSEDVSARRLDAHGVVAVTGVVPAARANAQQQQKQKKNEKDSSETKVCRFWKTVSAAAATPTSRSSASV